MTFKEGFTIVSREDMLKKAHTANKFLSISHTKGQRYLTVNKLTVYVCVGGVCVCWQSLAQSLASWTDIMLRCTVTGKLQCEPFLSLTDFKICGQAHVTV